MDEREQLKQAISALEAQRAILGDGVVEIALKPLREKLAELEVAVQPAEQRRKLVTVLFADVSGFTAMSETLDPEDVTNIMNALWQRLDAAINEQGGWIDKHIGDAVMALWGAETAQENDPERAIRAALAMQAALAEFRGERGVALAMRIGINTGQVLLGEVGSRHEFTAMGDVVNLASRLEHAAPVGGILISHDTCRHVRGIFDMQILEPIRVKGKVEPVQVYAVQRAKPRAFRMETRGVEGIETRLIGRQAEFRQLQRAFVALSNEGQGTLVTLVGDAGIGKSRLLREFEIWIDLQPQRCFFFKGRADASRQAVPYSLLRDLLTFRFEILESDSPTIACEKLEQGIGAVLPDDPNAVEKAHFIGYLIGLDFSQSPFLKWILSDAAQIRDIALHYLDQLLGTAAEQKPLLILLEDLHWADETSFEVLQRMAFQLEKRCWLILGAARPALFERRPDWGQGVARHRRIDLPPFSESESRELVGEILQKVPDLPDSLRDRIVESGVGNPFYVEELIKMLIEDGVIMPGAETWRVDPGKLAGMRVPATLAAVLQARFDRLPVAERRVLQQAAVVGQVFWDDAVDFVGNEKTAHLQETQKALECLRSRELIVRQEPPSFSGIGEFGFKHTLLQEAVYESVLKRERTGYHARAARWLQDHCGDRESELAAVIGRHWLQAGERAEAAKYFLKAGKQAAAQYANETALNLLGQALELTPAEAVTQRLEILLARVQIYDLLGRREAQRIDLEEMGRLADHPEVSVRQRSEVALQRADYFRKNRDFSKGVLFVEQAIELARQCSAYDMEAQAYVVWGRILLLQGEYSASIAKFEKASNPDVGFALPTSIKVQALRGKANIHRFQGNYTHAFDFHHQALRTSQQIQDRQGAILALVNLSGMSAEQAAYDQSWRYAEEALNLCREVGYRGMELDVLSILAEVSKKLGNFNQTFAVLEPSWVICGEMGNQWGKFGISIFQGELWMDLGQYDQSRESLEVALQLSRNIELRIHEFMALIYLGKLYYYKIDWSGTRKYCCEAWEKLPEQILERPTFEAQIRWLEGLVEEAEGQWEKAFAAYQQALEMGRSRGIFELFLDSLAGLARIALAQNDPAQAMKYVEELLELREAGKLLAAIEPSRVELTCYRVLLAAGDPRAAQVLAESYDRLQTWASRIDDPELRRSFLENVAVNRALATTWREVTGAG